MATAELINRYTRRPAAADAGSVNNRSARPRAIPGGCAACRSASTRLRLDAVDCSYPVVTDAATRLGWVVCKGKFADHVNLPMRTRRKFARLPTDRHTVHLRGGGREGF